MKDMIDRLDDLLYWAITSAAASVAAGVMWLIRRVLTNQRQIALLEAEASHRAEQRREDGKRLDGIERNIRDIHRVMMGEARDDSEG